nr:hypothetical protein [Tanacetum cinerariifolium]
MEESKVDRAVLELVAGSSKRDAEEELDQGGSKRQKTGESSKLDIQARVEADEELVHRLQEKEREKYNEDKQARMIVELINERKKYFAAQRAEARRNKPHT